MSGTVPPPPAALPPPGGRRVRRLTRWPVVIGSLVIILPVAAGFYALTHMGDSGGSQGGDDDAANTRSANAGAALAHASDGEIHGAALSKLAESPTAKPAEQRAPAPAAHPGETDAEHKMRANAWDAYYRAVASEKERRVSATLAALTADTIQTGPTTASGGVSGGSSAEAASRPGFGRGGPGAGGGGPGGPGVGGSSYFGAHGPSDPTSDYSPYTLTEPLSDYEIKAGDVITGTLIGGIDSDTPGEVVGLVGKPVLDYATHTHVLIPQGTRIVGSYNTNVSYGQDRLEVGLERLIYPAPCAQSLDLGRMAGSDISGRAGFEDQTNNHYGKTFVKALLLAGVSAGVQLSQPQQSVFGYPSTGQIAAGALGQQFGQLGIESARRGMDIPPTQEIRSGYPFTLKLERDIPFAEPYSCPQADQQAAGPISLSPYDR